ncbi:integrase [Cupriavidus necator]|uniref:integrase n=1 Tax=Cupriavidus necator TaxID=106590 RepID=UPI003F735887
MTDVVVFTPKAGRNAKANMLEFIAMCRDELKVFGGDLPFDDNVWDITHSIELKARGEKRFRVPFSTLSSARRRETTFMATPFLEFAKADFRYSFGLRPTKSPQRRLVALRALEHALCENGERPDPTYIKTETFIRAAQLVRENFEPASAYRIGGQLEQIAEFLSSNRLVAIGIDWRNSLPRPVDTTRVGEEFDARRNEKLPSPAALDAIPKIFRLATEPGPRFASSIAAILCSAPDRINEVLMLPVDCEVRQTKPDGTEAYGLRWWPAKGADPMVKWVVPSMADVVSEAIKRIREISIHARFLAAWYEDNPGKAYLSDEAEHLRGQEWLSAKEINLVVFGHSNVHRQSGTQWCTSNGVSLTKRGRSHYAKFADLENALIGLLPRGFPWLNKEVGLKYRDALCITRANELHTSANVKVGQLSAVTVDQFNLWLGSSNNPQLSIFWRHEFREDDGSPIKVTSHQFRHYLNTLAQAGGMSQLDIAKWSGRRDIRQNSAYDHVTADELVLKIRNAIGDDRQLFGPLSELPKRIVIHRDEFARLKVPTAHTTEFGVCIHDYTMSPCQLHADCMNCNEQVCIKGDEVRTARIRAELDAAASSLAAAEQADRDGYFGASRWVQHHRLMVERLTQLCALLDDPQVPTGAVIQLSSLPAASRIEQAVQARAALPNEPAADDDDKPTEAMRNLLTMMEG